MLVVAGAILWSASGAGPSVALAELLKKEIEAEALSEDAGGNRRRQRQGADDLQSRAG
jgi:hypothetical protein